MTTTDSLREDPTLGLVYECVFCGTLNPVRLELPRVADSMEIEITAEQEAQTKHEAMEADRRPSGRPWIACIDVSGSMAGPSIESVKQSLLTTIDSLAGTGSGTRFGLIEFESEVRIRNLLDGSFVTIPPGSYSSFKAVQEKTRQLLDRVELAEVESNLGKCRKHIKELLADGGTALGPAMASALVLAAEYSADRVVLLTDGAANVGIGALEGPTIGGPSLYHHLAKGFKDIGTAVDIVGVVSGSHLHLRSLGALSQLTRGTMYYVGTDEIERSMKSLSGKEFIASDLVLRLIGPDSVGLTDVSGVSFYNAEELKEIGQMSLSSVSDNDEIYFRVEPRSEVSGSVTLQLQVSYLNQKGERKSRVFTKGLAVTSDEKEMINSIDPTLSSTYAVQKSAEQDMMLSDPDTMEAQTDGTQDLLSCTVKSLYEASQVSDQPSIFQKCARRISDTVHTIRERTSQWGGAHMLCYSPPVYRLAKRDYQFVDALKRSRMSRDELFA
jgi:hypothetical protein